MTKYFVDEQGRYLGGYDGAEPPEGAIEVPLPPADARMVWDGSQFGEVAALVPQVVTRRQARQALLLAGLLDDVPVAIAAIEDDTQRRMAQIEWEDSLEFERSRPLVTEIAAAIGLDGDALDQLFITAAGL